MTQVIRKFVRKPVPQFLLVTWFLLIACPRLRPLMGSFDGPTPIPTKPGEELYLRLRSVELDPARVYKVRDAALDYPKLHVTLDDGKIAFTSDVYGRVTGAFFQGDGELLVVPPNQAERASMTLFTGAAILEEQFKTAYLRFNDELFAALQPDLQPADEAKDFVAEWGSTAKNLAASDALRLFISFSHCLPAAGQFTPAAHCEFGATDRFLHARVEGSKLGVFDVNYDSVASEQVSIGQQKAHDGVNYYNVWAEFAVRPSAALGERQFRDEIAIRSYQIDTRVNPPTNLQATARMHIAVLDGGSRTLVFELSRHLKVGAVSGGSTALEFIQNQAVEGTQLDRRGNDVVAVVFPQVLEAGQQIELSFSYGGDVLSEAGGGLLYVGARGIWYPNRGMADATFDLNFRYPAGWTLLATGTRRGAMEGAEESRAPAEIASHWTTKVAIPVAGFNLGRYYRADVAAETASIETYAAAGVERTFPKPAESELALPPVPPLLPPLGRPEAVPMVSPTPSPARNAQRVAETAARAIDFYSQRFGPYPYGTLRLTQMPGPLSQGWPGLVFLSSFSFLSPDERAHLLTDPVDAIVSQQVTAHETAHQWWGDLVFWRGYRDQWLFEGLANYCSLMILETENSIAFHRVMNRYRDNLAVEHNKAGAALKDAGPVTLGLRLSSSEFPDGYEAISYGRGTWLFHMLRHMLDDRSSDAQPPQQGTNHFARALHNLRQRYAGQPVTTHEVLEVFADELPQGERYEGKKQLDWFEEGWVNGTAIPHFQFQGVKFSENGRMTLASGTILEKDAPADLVTSVPVFAQLAGNRRIYAGRVFADGPETAFRIRVPAGTRKLLLDSEGTVLRK